MLAEYATKYEAMKRAILEVLPKSKPGLTVADTKTAVLPLLPQYLYHGGAKAGWWFKAVQLDLEAKSVLGRRSTQNAGPPLPFRPS